MKKHNSCCFCFTIKSIVYLISSFHILYIPSLFFHYCVYIVKFFVHLSFYHSFIFVHIVLLQNFAPSVNYNRQVL